MYLKHNFLFTFFISKIASRKSSIHKNQELKYTIASLPWWPLPLKLPLSHEIKEFKAM